MHAILFTYHTLSIRKRVVAQKSKPFSNAIVLARPCPWCWQQCKRSVTRRVHTHTHQLSSYRQTLALRANTHTRCNQTSRHNLYSTTQTNTATQLRITTTLSSNQLVGFRSHSFASPQPVCARSKPVWWSMDACEN